MDRDVANCPFCSPQNKIILENDLVYAVFDNFPVSNGHTLIIPKRHIANYFDLSIEEQNACQLILNRVKEVIDKKYAPDGYNVGININSSAGQTIPHVHIHLIPRYKDDVEDPVGGVRNVIAEKGNYVKNKNLWGTSSSLGVLIGNYNTV